MNINQLPENHHVISSMVNPFDANEELFFVVNPNEQTQYWDLNIWFCDMGTGEVRVTEPYDQVSDTRLKPYMEEHVSDNPEHFAKPPASTAGDQENFDTSKPDHLFFIEKIPGESPKEYLARKSALTAVFIECLEERDALQPKRRSRGTYTDFICHDDTTTLASQFGSAGDTPRLNPFSINSDDRTYMMVDSVQERANTSKALHHPSPEEISGRVSKEFDTRKTTLKALLESEDGIYGLPKKFELSFPWFDKTKPKKPNRNLNTIMGLLARVKK